MLLDVMAMGYVLGSQGPGRSDGRAQSRGQLRVADVSGSERCQAQVKVADSMQCSCMLTDFSSRQLHMQTWMTVIVLICSLGNFQAL